MANRIVEFLMEPVKVNIAGLKEFSIYVDTNLHDLIKEVKGVYSAYSASSNSPKLYVVVDPRYDANEVYAEIFSCLDKIYNW